MVFFLFHPGPQLNPPNRTKKIRENGEMWTTTILPLSCHPNIYVLTQHFNITYILIKF